MTVLKKNGIPLYHQLKEIFEGLTAVIAHWKPTEMALEAPFFGKNVQSMLKLGRAQGVAMAAGLVAGLSITEYAPKEVKRSITGNGNATKEQVAGMLEAILHTRLEHTYLDATDALGVAITHYNATQHGTTAEGGSKFKSWKDFVSTLEKKK